MWGVKYCDRLILFPLKHFPDTIALLSTRLLFVSLSSLFFQIVRLHWAIKLNCKSLYPLPEHPDSKWMAELLWIYLQLIAQFLSQIGNSEHPSKWCEEVRVFRCPSAFTTPMRLEGFDLLAAHSKGVAHHQPSVSVVILKKIPCQLPKGISWAFHLHQIHIFCYQFHLFCLSCSKIGKLE